MCLICLVWVTDIITSRLYCHHEYIVFYICEGCHQMSTSCFIFARIVTRHFGHWSRYKTINFDLIHSLEKAHELSAEHTYCPVLQMRINIAANWAALCTVGWSLIVLNYFVCVRGCIAESIGASVYIECIVEIVTKTGLTASVLNARESDLRLQLLVQKLVGRLERDNEILDLKKFANGSRATNSPEDTRI